MKVLLFTKMFPRNGNDNFGSYVYDEIKALSDLGVEIKVVSPHLYIPKMFSVLGGKFKSYANAPERYSYGGLDVYSPTCIWIRGIFKDPDLKFKVFKSSVKNKLIDECRKFKPDLIYTLDATMDGRLCVELKDELKVPIIIIEHSMPKFYNDLYGAGNYESIYSKVVNKCDEIIFVSNPQCLAFRKIIGNEVKSKVILNGFRNEIFDESASIMADNTIKLICIGYLEERKGYPVLLKALGEWKQYNKAPFQLTIIGDGFDRNKYEQLCVEYNLTDDVTFAGIVSHAEVYEKLTHSDIFVLPSYGEALGISYLEAMSCGLPVIGTAGEGISDIIIDRENGLLVQKGDTEGIRNAINYLIEDKERAKLIGRKGKDTVKNLTWMNNAIQLKIEIEQCIACKE
ncbi:MAG: glycosyltransferase family 4 protein [Clostridiales bacterium]|nr:glycosyltransferase family 4 protein [Clostridiales bacterium]